MILVSSEFELLLFSFCLFIYDSSQLLFLNEVILKKGGSRWSFELATELFEFRGKRVYIPNPLALHLREYKFYWGYPASLPYGKSPIFLESCGLHLQVFLAYASWILLFVLLPLLFFLRSGPFSIAICAMAIYLVSVISALFVMIKHCELGLTSRQAKMLAIELVLCPAFTPNLVRRLSNARESDPRLIIAARSCFSGADWSNFKEKLLGSLSAEIDFCYDDYSKHDRLIKFREDLLKEV